MNIYPDFYNQFECIGKDCLSTCCAGWGINFDSETMDFYRKQTDEFGQFICKHTELYNDMTMVTMTDTKRCPFLDAEGLCRIYINYGEEHMSDTCKIFPRRILQLGDNSMYSVSLSCERVLEMLYDKTTPIRCQAEGSSEIITMNDLMMYELAQFIAWGIELLQDDSIPFSAALGTVLYVGMEISDYYKQRDFENFEAVILRAPEIMEQFIQSKEALSHQELSESAWQLMFGIIDTFCLILKEANVYESEKFLWPAHIFSLSDGERKHFVRSCYKSHEKSPLHITFIRRLTALSFIGHAMALDAQTSESIFLQDICNYVILAEVLPATWDVSDRQNRKQYLSRLSRIARHFEQADTVHKFVYPVIHDLFAPDLFAYAGAFMTLFD